MIGLLAAAALAMVQPAADPAPLTIGETVTLVAFGQSREVKIVLPPDYAKDPEKRWPTAGESAAFRAWTAGTVKPVVEARYRTDSRAFLVGESAAGHFVVETWAAAPGLFTGYAAISPSLQSDFEAVSRKPLGEGKRPPLYLSLADEGGSTESGMMRLLEALPASQP